MSLENYIDHSIDILNQMPGSVCIVNLESTILFTNNNAAKTMGYKSPLDSVGTRYTDMKCKACEEASRFEEQDKLVLNKENKIAFLSHLEYSNDWKLVLGEKSLLFDNNKKIMGIIIYWTDVKNYNLIDMSRFIFKKKEKYYKTMEKNFVYLIEDGTINNYKLSERQVECLFLLLRGKAIREISNILQLSARTVESYINEIKFKMNCITKADIIEKAIQEGLFNIIPKRFVRY